MYPVSCILYHVSCIMYPVSCILYLYNVSCIMSPVSCILYHVSCFMSPVSSILYHLLICIMYPVLCLLYHVSCIMYHVSVSSCALSLMSVEGRTGPRMDWLLDWRTAALAARTEQSTYVSEHEDIFKISSIVVKWRKMYPEEREKSCRTVFSFTSWK